MVAMGPQRIRRGRPPYWLGARGSRPAPATGPSPVTLAGAARALVPSCGSGPSSPQATPAHHGSATYHARPRRRERDRAPRPRRSRRASTLPPVPTSGPLQAGSPIALPFSADRVTAAESPDGAVFAAPQDPTSPATSPWRGWSTATARPPSRSTSPTASPRWRPTATNFYVATYSNVYAYDRASGNQDGQWNMPAVNAANGSDDDLVSMAAAGGNVVRARVTDGRHGAACTASTRGRRPAPRLVVTRPRRRHRHRRLRLLRERRTTNWWRCAPTGTTVSGPGAGALAQRPRRRRAVPRCGRRRRRCGSDQPAGQGLDALFTHLRRRHARHAGVLHAARSPARSSTRRRGRSCSTPSAAPRRARPPRQPTPASCVLRIDAHGDVSDPVTVGAAVTLHRPGPGGRRVRHHERPVRSHPPVLAPAGYRSNDGPQ